jgi:phytoene/squalene synthetase
MALMRHEIAFARDLLMRGAELSWLVDRRLRRDVLMFAGGGLAILRAIEKIDYDVFNRRPKLGKLDYLGLGWGALRGRLSH